jgi:hypothetical protein
MCVLQLRGGGEEVVRLELAAVDARVEKAVTTLHVQQLQQEKALADTHLHDNYQRHKHELEIQQLQHFQVLCTLLLQYFQVLCALMLQYFQVLLSVLQYIEVLHYISLT